MNQKQQKRIKFFPVQKFAILEFFHFPLEIHSFSDHFIASYWVSYHSKLLNFSFWLMAPFPPRWPVIIFFPYVLSGLCHSYSWLTTGVSASKPFRPFYLYYRLFLPPVRETLLVVKWRNIQAVPMMKVNAFRYGERGHFVLRIHDNLWTGSPRVAVQLFSPLRRRIHRELQKKAAEGKSPSRVTGRALPPQNVLFPGNTDRGRFHLHIALVEGLPKKYVTIRTSFLPK